jgi:hypothetical protein
LQNKENLTIDEDLLLKALENDDGILVQKSNKAK